MRYAAFRVNEKTYLPTHGHILKGAVAVLIGDPLVNQDLVRFSPNDIVDNDCTEFTSQDLGAINWTIIFDLDIEPSGMLHVKFFPERSLS